MSGLFVDLLCQTSSPGGKSAEFLYVEPFGIETRVSAHISDADEISFDSENEELLGRLYLRHGEAVVHAIAYQVLTAANRKEAEESRRLGEALGRLSSILNLTMDRTEITKRLISDGAQSAETNRF